MGRRPGPQVRADHLFAARDSRARRARPRPQRQAEVRPRLRLLHSRPLPPPADCRTFCVTTAATAVRDPELHRRHQHRELLGRNQQVRRRTSGPWGSSTSTRTWTGRPDRPQARLCHGVRRGRSQQLDRTLAGFARTPNVGALPIGLGCETGRHAPGRGEHLELITLGGVKKKPLVLTIQESGGIGKTVEAGVKAVIDLLPVVSEYKGTLPAKHIMLGTIAAGQTGTAG